jgi:hypothetical protein
MIIAFYRFMEIDYLWLIAVFILLLLFVGKGVGLIHG